MRTQNLVCYFRSLSAKHSAPRLKLMDLGFGLIPALGCATAHVGRNTKTLQHVCMCARVCVCLFFHVRERKGSATV